jgi:Domain of unknown function (DUF4276)
LKAIEVYIIAEGPSEELFIKRVIAPSFQNLSIYLKPLTLETSLNASGGALNFDRLKRNARNILAAHPKAYLTTLIDLYALPTDFPSFLHAQKLPSAREKASFLATQLDSELIEHTNCRAERILTHIQPYEFEGLFFSNPQALSQTVPEWHVYRQKLQGVRDQFETPEHINNSIETKPSKRLEDLLTPRYKKTRHAALIGQKIGLSAIEKECPHFAAWLQQLRDLKPL